MQPVLLGPVDVGDRVVDVVQEDLRETGAASGPLVAEVDEPAVVRADADESALVVVGRRRGGDHRAGGEERRHRVRERDLGDDAVGVQVGDAALVVPVAGAAVVLEVAERVGVLAAPGVELLLPLGFVRYSRYVAWLAPAWQSDEMIVYRSVVGGASVVMPGRLSSQS